MPAMMNSAEGSKVGRHQRRRGQPPVVALLEVRQEGLADLVGSHGVRRLSRHPDDDVPRQQHGGLAGAAPSTGSRSATRSPSAARQGTGRRAVAQLDARRPRPRRRCRRTPAQRDLVVGERLARPDGHGVGAGVGGQHVQRLGRAADAEAAALADGEVVMAAVAAELRAARGRRSRRAARAGRRGARGTRARPVPARKQRSCESGLRATGSPASRASRAHLGLASARRAGSACARATRGRQRGEHVGLVLGRVGGGAQQAVGRACARSGRWPAPRRRGGRRGRASRRGARGRCSARTGSASARRRGRRATARRRRRGTRRAGRASNAAGPCGGRARARRARRRPSSTSARRRSRGRATARA